MKQSERRLIQLVNLSGHSQTGYFDPVPMRDIEVRNALVLNRPYTNRELQLSCSGGYTTFTVPSLRIRGGAR
jgi:hypothetical protein